jgi:hypothetical protein
VARWRSFRRGVGDRLPQSENPQDQRMNLDVIAIDLGVERFYSSPGLRGSAGESLERQRDGSFTPSTHRKDMGSQLPKLGLEISAGMRGRPAWHVKRMT